MHATQPEDQPSAGSLKVATDKDQELRSLLETAGGKEVFFEELIRQYQKPLYGIIRKMVISHEDADDLLQETFLKVWHGVECFRWEASLETWLYRVATNEALGHLRKLRKRRWLSLSDPEVELVHRLESDPYFVGDDAQKQLQTAVLRLPDQQRLVFHLRYYDEMPYRQMAEVTGLTEGGLKANFHHAVKKIRHWLGESVLF